MKSTGVKGEVAAPGAETPTPRYPRPFLRLGSIQLHRSKTAYARKNPEEGKGSRDSRHHKKLQPKRSGSHGGVAGRCTTSGFKLITLWALNQI